MSMIETDVKMTMWNADNGEVEKMMTALNKDQKFLFSGESRRSYGFPVQYIGEFETVTDWDGEDITVQTMTRRGNYIEFHFKMVNYVYPESLRTELRKIGWKIEAKWRQNVILGPYNKPGDFETSVGELKEYRDDDFPVSGNHVKMPGTRGVSLDALLLRLKREC